MPATVVDGKVVGQVEGQRGDKDVQWSSIMKLISRVTNRDMGRILFTLAEARQRPQNADFLEGFPWLSVIWHKVEQLDVAEFEHLYLLWDGVAWGKPGELPRRLKEGTQEFMDMVAENIGRPHFGHLRDILEQRDAYRAGQTDAKPFLIVVARDVQGPFLLLDGNHRAVAAQWCATESGKQDAVPHHAWMGLSPRMGDYRYYQRVLEAAESARGQ